MTEMQSTIAAAILATIPGADLGSTRVRIERHYTQLDVQSVDSWSGGVSGLACRIADYLSTTLALEKDTPAGAEFTPAAAGPVIVYRAGHEGIVAGIYTTAEAARQHCEALVSREHPTARSVLFDWLADEEDDDLAVAELVVQVDGGDEATTGYTVTPLEVATAYDPDADE
ncbi:hypothetical protein [Streptomyces nitrosporeus]|uniref:hypothetical protein n=1 Tax=Streptomyces nitrosporeus TaxID=28894 RepID=UPI0039A35283